MNAFAKGPSGGGRPHWSLVLAMVATVWGTAALAQVVSVPAAHLNHAEGTVAWSPQGDTEWHDVQPRRVLKRGDRLWTDRGSRAEVQAGGHALRLDSQTQLVLENVSENATQLSLTQGSVVLTVTRVNAGDSVELGTPNLAFRARQPGDYRIDVDTRAAVTRVVVLSGAGVVYGEKGEALELHSGQRASFRERSLGRMQQAAFAATDDFDRWAGARRRGEPTVSMPAVAQAAPAAAPSTGLINKGRDIIIAGPASALPGARQPVTGPVATANPPFQIKGPAMAAAAAAPAARAQAIPNVAITPAAPAVVPLRVTSPAAPATPAPAVAAQAAAQAQAQAAVQAQAAAAQAAAQAQAQAPAEARAQAQAKAQSRAQAQAARAQQQERERIALQQKQEEEGRASVRRAEDERKAAAARRADDQHRAVAARRAEEERRHVQQARKAEEAKRQAVATRREQEHKRLQARRAEEKRLALQRKVEEKRQAVARAAEAQKLAEARKRHLARLQEQAGREEQAAREAQARREQQARRTEQDRREEQVRQEEQARREESDRRQRQLADQWRRDQERRDQEVWLRQQQVPQQPVRPAPMGVPFRRVS
jgi:hypothetical protein